MKKINTFFLKYLLMSKKSITFAPNLEITLKQDRKVWYTTFQYSQTFRTK